MLKTKKEGASDGSTITNKMEKETKKKPNKVMTKVKEIFNHVFIEGLTGMAWGLFCTLIIGLIIEQIGKLIGANQVGNLFIIIGKLCSALTGVIQTIRYCICRSSRFNWCFC